MHVDEQLIECLTRGDSEARGVAWVSWYRAKFAFAVALARQLFPAGADHEDIASEAIDRAIRGLLERIERGDFEWKGAGKFVSYLNATIRSRVLDLWRKDPGRRGEVYVEDLQREDNTRDAGELFPPVESDPLRDLDSKRLVQELDRRLPKTGRSRELWGFCLEWYLGDTVSTTPKQHVLAHPDWDVLTLNREKNRLKRRCERILLQLIDELDVEPGELRDWISGILGASEASERSKDQNEPEKEGSP